MDELLSSKSSPGTPKSPQPYHPTGLPVPRSKSREHALSSRVTDATTRRADVSGEHSRAVVSMSGGGSGAASLEDTSGEGGSAEWRRIYYRVEALLPQVEELAAGRARLEAANRAQREYALEARLRKAEVGRRRWKAAFRELSHDASGKLAALRQSDLEDSSTGDALFVAGNSQEKGADHEEIARDLRTELRKLKQACETLSSNKDKEVSALGAVRDFLWNQLRTIEKENMALLKIKEVEAQQATEAAQKLQQKIEELEMAARIKDDVIGGLREENKETSYKRPRLYSKMCIFIKIHAGKTISLEVADSDTIYSVKAKIQDKEGIPAGHLRLMYINKLLVGSRTLKEQNIQEEDILHIVFRGMHIIAKMQSGKSVTLEVESSDTIYSVKAKIFDQTCMAPAGQRLFFADKLLEDGCTLADYNIQNDSVLGAEFLFPLERLRISVKTRTEKSIIEHAFMRSDTVDDVKARIYAELGIPPDDQRLFSCGDLLEDGQPLFPEICGAGTLHLHLRPPGGQ